MTDRRNQPFRRQVNEAFCAPDGSFSITKFLAVWSQIVVLAHLGKSFDNLIHNPEALLIVLAFLICPDLIKKIISVKWGAPVRQSGIRQGEAAG